MCGKSNSRNTGRLLDKTQWWQWEASEAEEMQSNRFRISRLDITP